MPWTTCCHSRRHELVPLPETKSQVRETIGRELPWQLPMPPPGRCLRHCPRPRQCPRPPARLHGVLSRRIKLCALGAPAPLSSSSPSLASRRRASSSGSGGGGAAQSLPPKWGHARTWRFVPLVWAGPAGPREIDAGSPRA